MKSKLIAISAVSSGLTAIFLTIGAYIEPVDLFSLVIASIFVVMPLYYKSYKASFLAYLAGGITAFLISGFNLLSVVFPAYFGFFGLFPIIRNLLQEKNFNKILTRAIGLVWCVISIFGIFFYYSYVMNETFGDFPLWVINNIYWVLGALAVAFYFVYDYSVLMARRISDKYLNRIIK